MILRLVLLLVASGSAQALTLGERTCADAAFIGSIADQRWEHTVNNDPNAIAADGLDHITFRVESRLSGPVFGGTVNVSAVAHTYLNPENRHVRVFLKRDSEGAWWIAQCDPSPSP